MNPTVLVISHYLKGDLNNALGIARAIARPAGQEIEIVDVKLRANILIPLLRRDITAIRRHREADRRAALRRKYRLYYQGDWPTAKNVSAVVSTLGRGEAPGAFLALALNVPAIHLGSLRRMRHEDFALVIAHQGISAGAGEVELPVSPSPLLRDEVKDAGKRYLSEKSRAQKRFALLIGGDTSGLHYSEHYWRSLLNGIRRLSKDLNAIWLITTSPRTSHRVEEMLEQLSFEAPEIIERLTLFHRNPEPVLAELLGASDGIFVTAESVSMISDAVANGKAVVAITENGLPAHPRVREFLDRQLKAKQIIILDADRLGTTQIDFDQLKTFSRCWSCYLYGVLADNGVCVPGLLP